MSYIQWDESFSVNNTEIDDQHKKWIEILDKMHETIVNGDQKAQETITADILRSMQDYIRYHFASEEEYMRKINYPGLVEHMRIHKDFDTQVYGYNRDIRDGKIILNTRILKIIKNWLLDHILIEDKKYSRFATEVEKQRNN